MSEFWKEHKINPMSGCLPMLLQMPIFFGFFFMIRTAIELRGVPFLWVHDLSKPDTLYVIKGLTFIPFGISTQEGLPINLLPLLMGVTMLWQARLTPMSPGMDPAQAKMMKYLPAIFILFLYNYSAGLALYWTVQNLLSVLQTKLTRVEPTPGGTPVQTATILTPASKKKK
jgi:YidC/Oxa1 family membrane protein insertase